MPGHAERDHQRCVSDLGGGDSIFCDSSVNSAFACGDGSLCVALRWLRHGKTAQIFGCQIATTIPICVKELRGLLCLSSNLDLVHNLSVTRIRLSDAEC